MLDLQLLILSNTYSRAKCGVMVGTCNTQDFLFGSEWLVRFLVVSVDLSFENTSLSKWRPSLTPLNRRNCESLQHNKYSWQFTHSFSFITAKSIILVKKYFITFLGLNNLDFLKIKVMISANFPDELGNNLLLRIISHKW